MKKLGRVTLIVAVVVASLSLIGCVNESQTKFTPAKNACLELMKKIPAGYEDFEFWDVKALRDDAALKDMYRVWYERKAEYLETRYGIDSTAIAYLAEGDGLLDIYKVEYAIEPVREKIQAGYYRDTAYENIEVWKSQPSHDPQSPMGGWVFTDGLLVRGGNNSNVDDYLRVVSGEEPSKYSDNDTIEMLEKLPSGITTRISQSTYQGVTMITGMAVNKEADGALRWTNIMKFESSGDDGDTLIEKHYTEIENSFKNAESELARRSESPLFHDFSLEREGNIIKFSMLVEEMYMIALLFYG